MRRLRLPAVAVALVLTACGPSPSPSGTASATHAAPARLLVTGSGSLCLRWYEGCGAVLAVEAPGWSLPEDWAPSADDTVFDARPDIEGPTLIAGVRQPGQDRIEPGNHRLVVIVTTSPDTVPQGTFSASVGCEADVAIAPGTVAVTIDVDFGSFGSSRCGIEVSMDVSTPVPNP